VSRAGTVAALLYVLLMVRLVRPPLCRDYGGWWPYEDETGFGYKDWLCQLPRGHAGKHWARA
jgi:hypothetical protein